MAMRGTFINGRSGSPWCYKHALFLLLYLYLSYVFSPLAESFKTGGASKFVSRQLRRQSPVSTPVASFDASRQCRRQCMEYRHVFKNLGFLWSSQKDHHRTIQFNILTIHTIAHSIEWQTRSTLNSITLLNKPLSKIARSVQPLSLKTGYLEKSSHKASVPRSYSQVTRAGAVIVT